MDVVLRKITGNWTDGYALDKHSISSKLVGHNEQGHPIWETLRTETGEAVFLLKYRQKYEYIQPLAEAVVQHIVPHLENIGFVIPTPASTTRTRQPVHEIAKAVSELIKVPFFDGIVVKSADAENTNSLKNMTSKAEKETALNGRFALEPIITTEGKWNVLVVDDLYHTGATMEAVCQLLSGYNKVNNVYVAALTWR